MKIEAGLVLSATCACELLIAVLNLVLQIVLALSVKITVIIRDSANVSTQYRYTIFV